MQLTLCFQYDIDKDQVLVKNSKESESPSKLISVIIIIVSTFRKLVVANSPQSKPTVIQFHVCYYYLSVNHRLHMQNQFECKLCPFSVSYISYPILLNSEIDRLISKQQIKLLVIQFISGSQAFRMDFNKQSVAQIVKIKCRVCTRELYRKNFKAHLESNHPTEDNEALSPLGQSKISYFFQSAPQTKTTSTRRIFPKFKIQCTILYHRDFV